MEVIAWIEFVRAGIGEVDGVVGGHGHEDLHETEQAGEHAFVRVFFDLIGRLADGYAAFLELDMDQWHAIDEEHEVAAPRVQHRVLGWIDRLLNDLVGAFASRDLLAVIDVETDFLAEMRHIFFVVTRDRHGTPVDERIERERRSQGLDLLDYLCHFPVRQRVFAKPVYVVVVAVQYVFPIVEQIPLSWIAQDTVLPSMLLKHGDDVFLKHRFAIEYHDSSLPELPSVLPFASRRA